MRKLGCALASLLLSGCSVWSFFDPPLIRELCASRTQREDAHTQKYVKQGIVKDIAHIAAVCDRMEEDYKQLKAAVQDEKSEAARAKLKDAMQQIDDEVDIYLDSVAPTLNRHKDKAFRRMNMKLLNFVQTLQSREFLVEMLAPDRS